MAQSNDPDVDAVMGSFDHPEAAHDSDAATVLASYDTPSAGYRPASGSDPAFHGKQPELLPLLWEGGKEIAQGLVHGAGTVADVFTGTSPGAGSHAERWASKIDTDPTLGGQVNGQPAISPEAVSSAYDKGFGTGPLAATLKERIPQAAEAISTVVPAIKMGGGIAGKLTARAPVIDTQAALDAAAAQSKQSMGAAASAPRFNSLSPDLQQGVRNAVQKTGGAVPPETLARHIEADSLPVKMQLTEGQATQDPQTISQEMNTRGRTPEMVARLNQQNQQLIDNVRELRDRVGPDVFTTNPVDHGDTLIKTYVDKGEAADAETSAAYKELRDANGGQFPVDVKQLYGNAAGALHQELLFEHAPKQLAQLEQLAKSGEMNFEQFEAMRTTLARTMRSSSDANEVAAAGVIRGEMEKLPLQGEAAALKPLADKARGLAKAQFAAVEADPAYKAALSGKIPADRFVQKFITGPTATRDGVALMRENLSHDPVATQTMGVAALDHLRQSAGIDPMGNGNFGQASFNKALVALDPKLQSLIDPKTAEHLGTLGNVARYTQIQPRGSFVNNSNTLVGALAEHGKNLAEGAANTFLGARVIPVGTMVREAAQKRAAAKATARSLAPGAGLTRLSDVAKQ